MIELIKGEATTIVKENNGIQYGARNYKSELKTTNHKFI